MIYGQLVSISNYFSCKVKAEWLKHLYDQVLLQASLSFCHFKLRLLYVPGATSIKFLATYHEFSEASKLFTEAVKKCVQFVKGLLCSVSLMFLYVDLSDQFPEHLLCPLELSDQLFLFPIHLGQ